MVVTYQNYSKLKSFSKPCFYWPRFTIRIFWEKIACGITSNAENKSSLRHHVGLASKTRQVLSAMRNKRISPFSVSMKKCTHRNVFIKFSLTAKASTQTTSYKSIGLNSIRTILLHIGQSTKYIISVYWCVYRAVHVRPISFNTCSRCFVYINLLLLYKFYRIRKLISKL